jgi:hypothetical protein
MEQHLELASVFQEATVNFLFIFLFEIVALKFKNCLRM